MSTPHSDPGPTRRIPSVTDPDLLELTQHAVQPEDMVRHPAQSNSSDVTSVAAPPVRKRAPRRTSCLRLMVRVALFISMFTILFSALLMGIYRLAPPPRLNILLLGIDSRPNEGDVTRSDSIILFTVDPKQPYVGMLSIPRDLYVNIPNYGYDRINVAHALGELKRAGSGPDYVARTIEANFGVEVHRTVRINFQTFIDLINAAGGVTVDVPSHIIDYEYPTMNYGVMTVEFQPGVQHMNGEQALEYARTRHTTSDSDRSKRQQQIVAALISELVWPSGWKHIPAVVRVIQTEVDTDLTTTDVMSVLPAMIWLGQDGVDRRVIEGNLVKGFSTDAGASVLDPQWNLIQPVLVEMFLR
jgi:polyisoprenyl-teichoic acid--peptidoglycan teichoic acid transferase